MNKIERRLAVQILMGLEGEIAHRQEMLDFTIKHEIPTALWEEQLKDAQDARQLILSAEWTD